MAQHLAELSQKIKMARFLAQNVVFCRSYFTEPYTDIL